MLERLLIAADDDAKRALVRAALPDKLRSDECTLSGLPVALGAARIDVVILIAGSVRDGNDILSSALTVASYSPRLTCVATSAEQAIAMLWRLIRGYQ